MPIVFGLLVLLATNLAAQPSDSVVDLRYMLIEHHVGLMFHVGSVLNAPPGVDDHVVHDAGLGIVVGWVR